MMERMRMIKPNIALAFLLTGLLAACGGDSGDSVVPENPGNGSGNNGSDGTGSGGITDPDLTPNEGEGSLPINPVLVFEASMPRFIVQSQRFDFKIEAHDQNRDRELVTRPLRYVFTSTCDGASFENTVTESQSGSTQNTYRSGSCASAEDTITVRLFRTSDNIATATPISTQTHKVTLLTPKIGTGTGVGFRKNEINGVQVAEGATSTILSTNIVTDHPSAPNALLLSNEFEAKWSSDCPSFNFSIRNQSISAGSVATRYDTTCMGDNEVTLDVYPTGNPDQVLVTQRATITFSPLTITPALGNGVGAGFQVGQIAATSVSLAENQSTSLTVTAVDANNGNQPLSDNYRFVFSSECLSSGDAGLSITSVVASGAVNTTYTNKSCSGDDLVTARLFKEGADETDPANAISTATVVLSTIKPSLLLNSADDIAVVRLGSVDVSLSVVDVVRDNAILVNPYRFTFESTSK